MTILLAGGTGTLGTRLVPLLTTRGARVRVLTRDSARAARLEPYGVELALGDLRDAGAVTRAAAGAETVINAVQAGFGATGGSNPMSVDAQGSSNLLAAARASGARHLIMVSIFDVSPDHPLELWRMKYRAEQELRASGLDWTIIRATAFMEWATTFIGKPLVTTGKARIYGQGDNPINFVSATDVARFVELAVFDPSLRGRTETVAGSENLTFNQVVRAIQEVTGVTGSISHVPLPAMRIMARVMRLLNPGLGREIQAGIFLDTADRTADPSSTRARYPSVAVTQLLEVIRREFGEAGVQPVLVSP